MAAQVRPGVVAGSRRSRCATCTGCCTERSPTPCAGGGMAVNPCDAADQPRRGDARAAACGPASRCGAFLAATADDRLAPMWRLLLTTGMRRGELLGLRWSDVDLSHGPADDPPDPWHGRVDGSRPAHRRRGPVGAPSRSTPARSPRSRRGSGAGGRTAGDGPGWQDVDGLVVTEADGTPVHPQVLSRRFKAAAKRAGLPGRSGCTTPGTATPRPRSLPGCRSRCCRSGSGTPTSR